MKQILLLIAFITIAIAQVSCEKSETSQPEEQIRVNYKIEIVGKKEFQNTQMDVLDSKGEVKATFHYTNENNINAWLSDTTGFVLRMEEIGLEYSYKVFKDNELLFEKQSECNGSCVVEEHFNK